MIYFKSKVLTSCVATTSVIRQNIYDIKILCLFIGLIFELRIDQVFQYTQLQSKSRCTKYIYILNTTFTMHVVKKRKMQFSDFTRWSGSSK